MNKSDAVFGCLRPVWCVGWKIRKKIPGGVHRVDHNSLCRSGMRVAAVECYSRGACRPGLVLDPAKLFAIDGVGKFCAPAFNVKLFDAPPASSSGVNGVPILPCLIC